MIYVMSDLTGHLDEFHRMLQRIRFTKRDVLYLLGNIIDCGPNPILLLQELMGQENVYPLLGSREYRFLRCFEKLPLDAVQENYQDYLGKEQKKLLAEWKADGGEITIAQFLALEKQEREEIIQYLKSFRPFARARSCGSDYLLSHGGISNYQPGTEIESYPTEAFLGDFSDKMIGAWDKDDVLVFGHTPTDQFADGLTGFLYFGDGFIAMNCDVDHPEKEGRLGCLRLGDEKDYYIGETMPKFA